MTVGSCSAVLPGAVLEDGCVLGDMSLVMKNDTVPAGSGGCLTGQGWSVTCSAEHVAATRVSRLPVASQSCRARAPHQLAH